MRYPAVLDGFTSFNKSEPESGSGSKPLKVVKLHSKIEFSPVCGVKLNTPKNCADYR